MAQKVQPIFAEIALTQTVTQMRISADRTGKDLMGELRAKLRSEKNFLRKLRCRAICTALHLSLCVLPYGIRKQPAHRLGGFGLRKRCDVSVSVKREASGVVAKHSGDSFDVHAVLQSQGCKCVSKLVEATNGYSLVEAKNDIWYDIASGYGFCRSLFY